MTKLNETATKNKLYNELKTRLADSLPAMEVRMQDCTTHITPGN